MQETIARLKQDCDALLRKYTLQVLINGSTASVEIIIPNHKQKWTPTHSISRSGRHSELSPSELEQKWTPLPFCVLRLCGFD